MSTRSYQRFCSAKCRKQFFEYNNTAFGSVKHMVEKVMRAQQKEIERLKQRVDVLEKWMELVHSDSGINSEQAMIRSGII